MSKKFFFIISVIAVLGMTSCTTTLNSSKTKDFGSSAITATFADLVVSPHKITYTYKPTDDVRRGGEVNVINCYPKGIGIKWWWRRSGRAADDSKEIR